MMDTFSDFDPVIHGRAPEQPHAWETMPDGVPVYRPDYALLEQLLTIPVRQGQGQNTGRFAKAIDAWCAQELRRAGFGDDEVWPRSTLPRVFPQDLAEFIRRLPQALRGSMLERVQDNKTVAPAEAKVLGKVYDKQVDVIIAQWSRGPELMISTKSMLSSYSKNLKNRFEESYGDAKNLRGRFPMAATGFLYLLRSNVLNEPNAFLLAQDMLRKLREQDDAYDATCLLVAEWSDDPASQVTIRQDVVPDDLHVGPFLATMITCVLNRTPIQFHVRVRERREQRALPIEEGEDL